MTTSTLIGTPAVTQSTGGMEPVVLYAQPAEALPKRTANWYPHPESDSPVNSLPDPELLLAVLDGLHRLNPEGMADDGR